jgi:hypothetical protein
MANEFKVKNGIIISGSADIEQNLTVRGTLTADQYNVSIVSTSILYESGSTKFGDTSDDTHEFTGSVLVNGKVNASSLTGSLNFNNLTNVPTLVSGSSQISYTGITNIPSGIVSGSEQLTGSYDTRYVLSGSITQTTWDNIANKPNDIVSSSSQISVFGFLQTSSFNTFTSSYTTGSFTGSFIGDGSQLYNIPYSGVTGLELNKITSGSVSASISPDRGLEINTDTTITGSLTISGSNTLVQVLGDIQTDGFIRFDPVSKNIDTSISASYLFVSSSTNDLYFSQNGNGYSNVTRLRWLEGNMYSGLLHGGVITATNGGTTFNVSEGNGIIVSLNASLTDDPYPTIKFIEWNTFTGQTLTNRTTSIQTFLAIDDSGQIVQSTSPFVATQYNTLITLGTVLHQNQSTVNGAISYPNVAYGYKQRTYDFVKAFGPLRLSGLNLITSGSLGLNVGAGTAFSEGRNYQVDPNNPSYITDSGTGVSKIFRYYQVSGTTFVQDTNGGNGYAAIDPTKYVLNGVLTDVGGDYSIQRVFWYPNSVTKGIVVYYGNETYGTIREAIDNLNIETFNEVENTKQNAVYLGSIIIAGNGDFTQPNKFSIVPAGLFRSIGGSGGGGNIPTSRLFDLSDVNVTTEQDGDLLVYNVDTLKWESKKSLEGNYTITGSLNVTGGLTGSIDYSNLTNKPTLVSGSSQISYSGLTGIPSDIVSSSSQISAFGFLETSSFNTYTSSNDGRVSSLESKTGSYATTGSNSFVGNQNINGNLSVTGSVVISGSLDITNANVGNSRFLFTQVSGATTWSISHNLGYRYPNVTIYDGSNNKVMLPADVISVDANTTQVTFATPEYGYALVSVGGISTSTADRYLHTQTSTTGSWVIDHNIGYKYVTVNVYDGADEQLIPQKITAVSVNRTQIDFATPTSGNATITVGGPRTTSLFVQTGSYYNTSYNIGITGSLVVTGDVDADTFNTTSDKKLKTDLIRIEGALDKIEKLNGYTFNWLEEYSEDRTRQIGMIADEVYDVQPELISKRTMLLGGKEEEIKLLDYAKVNALLVEGIKELTKRVAKLENKNKKK